jgi:acetyl-CoA acetyltransferase
MDVWVLGVGLVPFGFRLGESPERLARRAVVAAVRDAGVAPGRVGAAYCGSFFGAGGMGQRILKRLGMTGIPIFNVENACASGADAVAHAVLAVESRLAEVALAIGVDTPSRAFAGSLVPIDAEDSMAGVTAPALYALRASRYMAEHGATVEQLAAVTVKNRLHGSANPIATFQKPVDLSEVLAAPLIADPLTRLQCCPVSDGAAAVVVGRSATSSPMARVRGVGLRSGLPLDQADRVDTVSSRAAQAAYEQAGISPDEIDACEVHDAFTIGELLAIESLGICEPGTAATYVESGKATLGGGGAVVNPSGGLLARGHPQGATGVAQIAEAALQLADRARARQVEGCRTIACHNRGGSNLELESDACVVTVLTRD